jgi:hypothetical protein
MSGKGLVEANKLFREFAGVLSGRAAGMVAKKEGSEFLSGGPGNS